MRAHIAADCVLGGGLAILPPVLRFPPGISAIYVLFGLFALGAAVLTAPSAADGPPDGMQVRHSSTAGPAGRAGPVPANPAAAPRRTDTEAGGHAPPP